MVAHHADFAIAVNFITRWVLQLALPEVAHHVLALPEERQVVLRNVQLLLTTDTLPVRGSTGLYHCCLTLTMLFRPILCLHLTSLYDSILGLYHYEASPYRQA